MRRRPLLLVIAVAALVLFVSIFYAWRSQNQDQGARSASRQSAPNQRGGRVGVGRFEPVGVLKGDDEMGQLRLEGQVIDATEAPVSRAVVTLSSNPPRVTTTEDDGSFFFDKVLERRYSVVARARSGVAGPLSVVVTGTLEPVILRLRSAASAIVTVVAAENGTPLSNAEVELRGLDLQEKTTNSDGIATFEAVIQGRYIVVASAPGFAQESVSTTLKGKAEQVGLALRRGAPVGGRVVTRDGAPVQGAQVNYAGASETEFKSDLRLDAVETDQSGRFRFLALPSGSFRFTARHGDFAPGQSSLVGLDGATEKNDVEIVLEPGATIRGQVAGLDGELIANARVRIAELGALRSTTREVRTGDSGRFEVSGLARKAVSVVALHESAASPILEEDLSTPPDVRKVKLILSSSGTIAGLVVTPDGQPVEGAEVYAWPKVADLEASNKAIRSFRLLGPAGGLSDAGGRFTIEGLGEDSYGLRALPPGVSAAPGQFWRREELVTTTGDMNARVILTPDGTIIGKVAFDDGEVPPFFTTKLGRRGTTPFSTRDGAFELADVPQGDYTLEVSSPSFDTRRIGNVAVALGAVTDLGTVVITRGRQISGRVTANNAPVPGASVRVGRFVLGDGSSPNAAQVNGPPRRGSTRDTRTDESGRFLLNGVSSGPGSIIADHPAHGRSPAVAITGSEPLVLELALDAFGVLEGVVRRGATPVGEVLVEAAPIESPRTKFTVTTGKDGAFRFDRLAPEAYRVSAMTGDGPIDGFYFYPKLVTVESGGVSDVDLAIESGEISLAITLEEMSGVGAGFLVVQMVAGNVTAQSALELEATIGAGDSFSYWGFAPPASTTHQIGALRPGPYTICVTPFPVEVNGRRSILEYMEREGDTLSVWCEQAMLTPNPAPLTMRFATPQFVPAG